MDDASTIELCKVFDGTEENEGPRCRCVASSSLSAQIDATTETICTDVNLGGVGLYCIARSSKENDQQATAEDDEDTSYCTNGPIMSRNPRPEPTGTICANVLGQADNTLILNEDCDCGTNVCTKASGRFCVAIGSGCFASTGDAQAYLRNPKSSPHSNSAASPNVWGSSPGTQGSDAPPGGKAPIASAGADVGAGADADAGVDAGADAGPGAVATLSVGKEAQSPHESSTMAHNVQTDGAHASQNTPSTFCPPPPASLLLLLPPPMSRSNGGTGGGTETVHYRNVAAARCFTLPSDATAPFPCSLLSSVVPAVPRPCT